MDSARTRTRVSCIAALLAAGLLFASGLARAAPTEVHGTTPSRGVHIGSAPPALDTVLVTGSDAVSLEGLRGRVVVLDFWATWCGPCRMIMPSLDAMSSRYHGRGLTVLGVARESDDDIRRHLERSPVGYTVARDLGHTMTAYGVSAIPMLVVIDRRGVVRDVVRGVDEDVMRRLDSLVAELVAEPAP